MRSSVRKSVAIERGLSVASIDSHFSDTISIGSGYKKAHVYARYNWKSNLEYIGTLLASSINIYNYHRVSNKAQRMTIPILHYFILMMVYALPLQYMQVTQGQFTQAGVIFLKYLCPLTYGLGYMFLVSTIIRLVYVAFLGSDFMLYLVYSIELDSPWFHCPENHAKNCWDNKTCQLKEPCLSRDIVLSTTAYWNYTYMSTITDKMSFRDFHLRRFAALVIFWGGIIWTLMYKVHTVSKLSSRIIFGLCIFIILLIVLSLLFTKDAIWGIFYMFNITQFYNLIEYKIWSEAIVDIITTSGIAKGGYLLLGSYLHQSSPSGVLTVLSGIMYILIIFLLEVMAQTSLGIILTRAKVSMEDKASVLASNREYEIFELTITPKGFQFTSTPQFISFVYFLMCVMLSGVFVFINVKIMEVCVEDCHPQFMRYRNYILILYYFINLLISLPFMLPDFFSTATHFVLSVLDVFDCINILVYTTITAWLYSVQQLSDDIHYFSGAQPSKYWKLCWLLSPIITAVGFAQTLTVVNNKFVLIFVMVLYVPFILMAGIQAFRYVKSTNLSGLFLAEERWGPPDVTSRNNRKIFNPRKEIHSRRRFFKCEHNCLLDSKVLRHVKDDEMKYYMYAHNMSSELDITN